MDNKDTDTTPADQISNASETPFTDGLEKELNANDERKARLKLAIKNHALNSRQKVKAKKLKL